MAVHCKAGLGRTGTLIGAYLIYKHGFTASEGRLIPSPPCDLPEADLLFLAIGFMRLMRPGSCVGPQQHFLYENQMTWIRWAAVDAYKASLPTIITPEPTLLMVNPLRPITPPNEIDLARSRHTTPIPSNLNPPQTPGRQIVPGQPRKTPGKSKHSVASPEMRDLVQEEPLEVGLVITDDMMLVEEDEGDDGPTTPTASTPTLKYVPTPSLISSPRKAPIVTSSRPTRIARARPLSAITDNRMIDRIGTTKANGVAEDFRRSKAVKDLGTLFESSNASTTIEVSGRYDLRGGRTSPVETLPSIASNPSATNIHASPSRLPQRIPATSTKRRAASRDKSCAMEVAVGGVGGLGRSVRRRRSSLGSTDFVVQGPGEL